MATSVRGGDAREVMTRVDAIATYSEETGAITRSYGSDALRQAQDEVRGWMQAAGLDVREDTVGNLVGRLEGARPDAPTFVLGSHIDSVRDAGRYDGPLGVLVALAAVERLVEERGRLPVALELVSFIDEEGLSYRSSYLGSRVFAGLFDESELEAVSDEGMTLADAIRAMGGDPTRLAEARRGGDDLFGYFELHIEQGPVLQANDLPVGIVTAIAGQSRGFVGLTGEAGHAGNTPPELRKDALCGAADLVLAVESVMREEPGLIATVGTIDASPNVGNVIPGLVTVSYDVRHQNDRIKEAAVERLREQAAEICARRGLNLEWRHLQEHVAVPCSPRLRALLVQAAEAVGASPFQLPSGAGHDAVSLAHLTEVSMLFVRCKDGISHHPDESVREEDVTVALDVVTEFLRRLGGHDV